MAPSLLPNDHSGYRAPSRFITTHDADGTSKFVPDHVVSPDAPWQEAAPGVFFYIPWGTTSSPAQMTDDADLKAYEAGKVVPNIIVTPNGTNVRIYDFAPGFESAMHRTYSIDYGIVIHGTIEGQMDGGEVRVGKPGDIFIQRGTNHLWRNPSKTEWTRICYFVAAAEPLVIGGKKIEAVKADNSSAVSEDSKL
ncbi:cupin domain-containing protein [Rhizodiscina lignyota]|uniref:Cupin domain-containing protein n=1 Tax=Rhizodiscina lignyota TaxID=1504668 RepID=A0A9P4MCP2_9PEZI|nr:cupin domain-containing protein [Rhizodiscina lignyota]